MTRDGILGKESKVEGQVGDNGLNPREVIELCEILNLLYPLIVATPRKYRPMVKFGTNFTKYVTSLVPDGQILRKVGQRKSILKK